MRNLFLFLLLILAVAGGWYGYTTLLPQMQQTSPSEETQAADEAPAEYTATFVIFTNGTFRVFTDAMYHNLSEDAFITAESPNTVNVTAQDVTWNDFFQSLPLTLTDQCLKTGTGEEFCNEGSRALRFYLNGELAGDFLSRRIRPGDRALVTFGTGTEGEISPQLQRLEELAGGE